MRPERARGQAVRDCADLLVVAFATLTLELGGSLSSGIVWANPDDHSQAFAARGTDFYAAGKWMCPTLVSGGTDFTSADEADIAANGTRQRVTCKIRFVDATGTPVTDAEVSAVWDEDGAFAGASVIGPAGGWTGDLCGIEAVLEVEDGPYGTVTLARWTLPEILTVVFM